jgi:hypothetical protein
MTPYSKCYPFAALAAVILCLSACKLLVHLYAGRHYGYFVDELYYLACSRHLDWGYVDQPPLIALITWFAQSVFGDSLPAIRLLPAVAGAGEVALTALIARELGGKRFAQGLAALATLVAPGVLASDNLLSMNAFEHGMTIFALVRHEEFDIKRLQGRLVEHQRTFDIADSQNDVVEHRCSLKSRVV